MDCSLPGSSVHGILQARILDWVTMPSSRGFSWPRDWACISLFFFFFKGISSVYFFLIIVFIIYFFTLQYCIGFAIYWHESAMGVHVFPSWTPLPPPSPSHPTSLPIPFHFPPHPIPQGHLSAPVLSTLSHALNLDWRFVPHMIIYMFQCHSPKPSHPCPLPQSPKDCSTHLCFFCCLAYRVSLALVGRFFSTSATGKPHKTIVMGNLCSGAFLIELADT